MKGLNIRATAAITVIRDDGSRQVMAVEDCIVQDFKLTRPAVEIPAEPDEGKDRSLGGLYIHRVPGPVTYITMVLMPRDHPQWVAMPPVFEWTQGPTDADPDPKKMWHTACGGEVYYLGGHYTCNACGQDDYLAKLDEQQDRS